MRPVLVAGVQRLLDEQSAKSRTVDEQIRRKLRSVGQLQCPNLAAQRIQQHLADETFDTSHAAALCEARQIRRIEGRIEMKRPGEACERRVWNAFQSREPRLLRGLIVEAVIPQRSG